MAGKPLLLGTLLLATVLSGTSRGSLVVHRTRSNGANAVRIGSHVFTLDRWIEFRQTNPEWFARNNPRLGQALTLGKTALLKRRALNPQRFDFYHRCLGWLLRDAFEDDVTSSGGPFLPPSIPPQLPPSGVGAGGLTPPPGGGGGTPPGGGGGSPPAGGGGNPPTGGTTQLVPEPSTWILLGSSAITLALFRRRRA